MILQKYENYIFSSYFRFVSLNSIISTKRIYIWKDVKYILLQRIYIGLQYIKSDEKMRHF